ncbi:PQ-loop-domain-containing protein [Pholiota conissans]|uniref:PQ-loop-domain-containing protein n=1 Tax=Pholiota conissans TaxID=109636 RepID=A0A9P5Z999_9AGAR|nr:PQ-loop-domain-containing protein [Pholiota conissans]
MVAADNLSSVLGWISIACWIVVYSPQIYENYTLQSGEGLSVLFVVIWILGDLTNVVGAILAGLLPTVIILGLYYTSCDFILLSQIYYYRYKKRRLEAHAARAGELEDRVPLLSNEERPEDIVPVRIIVIRYLSALAFVVLVGVGAWWITSGDKQDNDLLDSTEEGARWWAIQFLGWSSASLFLGARIPQILKNFKTRCEGLSPALFFFSIFGNTTYALSILVKSMDREYLIKNGGWLAGNLLTVFLDMFVLCQFSYYRYMEENDARMISG